jgi:Phage tail sheath C-terminal domain/Phage tail sheath protein subtilisin-like domain
LGFPVSPGIQVNEIDLTTIVPSVSTSMGAFAGVFRWGPVLEPTLVDFENILIQNFQEPTNFNAETYFTPSNFLAYGGACYVTRCANLTTTNTSVGALTAYGNTTSVSNALNLIVANHSSYANQDGLFETSTQWVAKWPGAIGNSLKVSVCYTANAYTSTINLASYGTGGATLTMNISSNVATITMTDISITAANTDAQTLMGQFSVTDLIQMGNSGPSGIGIQYLKITALSANATGNTSTGTGTVTINTQQVLQLHTAINVATSVTRYWEFYSSIGVAPGQSAYQYDFGNTSAQDELHLVISDNGGLFTGVPGTVLESYQGLSRGSDSLTYDGQTNWYKNRINQDSQYIWFTNDDSSAVSNTVANLASSSLTAPVVYFMSGGADGAGESNVTPAVIATGYDKYQSKEDITVDLVMTGKAIGGIDGSQIPNYLIDNLGENRKDCVVFISPAYDDVVNNLGLEMTSIISYRNNLRSSSYGFLDSGYKYIYDRYNDIYRYVPLNGDMAGLCARTDQTNDAWWSPAGFNRGNLKNLVKLAYNPREAERDQLYPNGINPVVSFPGMGTVLYGDKTLLAKPSAFNRINVRRLFIVLERAISQAAQYTLFEFNDTFTRAQFVNLVNPYLRDIKGRRGITDFLVVCDETNNTPQIIDNNQFVGDIYIKPARSINFILLNFIAVPTGVAFSEVVGTFD